MSWSLVQDATWLLSGTRATLWPWVQIKCISKEKVLTGVTQGNVNSRDARGMTDLGRTCPVCVLCDWWSGDALSDTTVAPQRLPGKQLTSQLVNRIPFAYMTGAARVSVLGGWWKGWRSRYVTEWLIVSVSFPGLLSFSAVTLRLSSMPFIVQLHWAPTFGVYACDIDAAYPFSYGCTFSGTDQLEWWMNDTARQSSKSCTTSFSPLPD